MKKILLILATIALSSCSGGGGGSGSPSPNPNNPSGPDSSLYAHEISGDDEFPMDLTAAATVCSNCATDASWKLLWNEVDGVLTGVFAGPWGSIPVSGSRTSSSIILTATPANPVGSSNVDEIIFSIPVSYLEAEEGDILMVGIQAKSGGADVTLDHSAIYPRITKKGAMDVEVGGENPPTVLTDFASLRGRYEGTMTEVTNKIFPAYNDVENNPRGWVHPAAWLGKKYCDLDAGTNFKLALSSNMNYQISYPSNQYGGSIIGNSFTLESTPSNFIMRSNPDDLFFPSSTLGSKDGYKISTQHSPGVKFEATGSFSESGGKTLLSMRLKIIYEYPATGGQSPKPAFEEEACSYDLELERTLAF